MRTKLFLTLLALLTVGEAGFAQTNKNIPGPTDYAAFSKFVTDRNIFDPSRQPHYTSTRTRTRTRTRTTSSAPAFTLVGTMEYEKGMFAFFSGNSDELKKALQSSQKIAGYTVTDIAYGSAVLESADQKQKLELKVGDVMREENGKWELAGQGEVPAGNNSSESKPASTSAEGGSTSSSEVSAPASASAPNDILKRLMEKREQESK